MSMMMKVVGTSIAITALVVSVQGAPTAAGPVEASRPGVAPGWQSVPASNLPYVPITYPKSGEVWLGAAHHNVTWDTRDIPADKSFTNTAIFLAQKGDIVTQYPLASNFSLSDGRINVQAPKEFSGDDFQLVLYVAHGSHEDRGSYSPAYSIINAASPV